MRLETAPNGLYEVVGDWRDDKMENRGPLIEDLLCSAKAPYVFCDILESSASYSENKVWLEKAGFTYVESIKTKGGPLFATFAYRNEDTWDYTPPPAYRTSLWKPHCNVDKFSQFILHLTMPVFSEYHAKNVIDWVQGKSRLDSLKSSDRIRLVYHERMTPFVLSELIPLGFVMAPQHVSSPWQVGSLPISDKGVGYVA